jgi:hypothetical protein
VVGVVAACVTEAFVADAAAAAAASKPAGSAPTSLVVTTPVAPDAGDADDAGALWSAGPYRLVSTGTGAAQFLRARIAPPNRTMCDACAPACRFAPKKRAGTDAGALCGRVTARVRSTGKRSVGSESGARACMRAGGAMISAEAIGAA